VLNHYAQAVARGATCFCRRYLIAAPRPLPAAPLVMRGRYLVVVPRPLLAATRRCRSRRTATRKTCSGTELILLALSAQRLGNPRGDVDSASSDRWP
jgi:hypothetical protein